MSDQERRDSEEPFRFHTNHVREVEKDVIDLKVLIGRHDERLQNLATKEDLANRKSEMLTWAMNLLIPILAAALGALAILFSGIVQTVVQ